MLNKINHIGIAVSNIEKSKDKYIKLGYKVLKEIYDEIFLADLCLMKRESEIIELIHTKDTNSKLFNICNNNIELDYHKCYEVNNIEENIKLLKKNKYLLISDIVYSKLLGGKICFLYNKKVGIIELLEVKNEKNIHI